MFGRFEVIVVAIVILALCGLFAFGCDRSATSGERNRKVCAARFDTPAELETCIGGDVPTDYKGE